MNLRVRRLILFLLASFCLPLHVYAETGRDGIPVLWDTAWILPLADRATIENILSTRANQGFDGILMGVSKFGLENVTIGNGEKLFLADKGSFDRRSIGDVTRPNEAGFAYIDFIIQKADSLGLVIGLLPMNNGGSDDYVYSLTDVAGENRAFGYGFYLGTRYRDYRNIIWVLGGDVSTPSSWPTLASLTTSFKDGLRAAGAPQKISFHPGMIITGWPALPGSSTDWFSPDGHWLDFNMIQSGENDPTSAVRAGYGLGKPIGLGEGFYEGVKNSTAARIRAQAYKTYLSGGSYMTYGQAASSESAAASCCGSYGMLSTAVISQLVLAKNLMIRRGWQQYAPDESFIVSFSGDKNAAIKGNSAAMVYLSTDASAVTVDMSRVNASKRVVVTRFNPTDGTTVPVGTYGASGHQMFTTEGLTDAVILLDASTP